MSKEYGRKYMVTFDLSEKMLQQVYVESGYSVNFKKAWRDIKKTMAKLGFAHIQQSCYISEGKLTERELFLAFAFLVKENPWLTECLSENSADPFVVTPVLQSLTADYILGRVKKAKNNTLKKEDVSRTSFYISTHTK